MIVDSDSGIHTFDLISSNEHLHQDEVIGIEIETKTKFCFVFLLYIDDATYYQSYYGFMEYLPTTNTESRHYNRDRS